MELGVVARVGNRTNDTRIFGTTESPVRREQGEETQERVAIPTEYAPNRGGPRPTVSSAFPASPAQKRQHARCHHPQHPVARTTPVRRAVSQQRLGQAIYRKWRS